MVRKVVILGSGNEAMTLAVALMRPGFETVLTEPDADAAERAQFMLGRLQEVADPNVSLPRIVDTDHRIDLADIVFEAMEGTPEQRARSLAGRLKNLPDQVLLTTANPDAALSDRLIGFRLYAPARMRRLVEITPVSDGDLTAAFDLARAMGRVPVLCPAGRPSIGKRLQRRFYQEAESLLLQGAIPHELDEALVQIGFDMGVFEVQDLIGLDVAYRDRRRTGHPAVVCDRMVEEGRLGKMAGVGWYRYPGGGGAVIDPLVEDLISEEARFAGVEMRAISARDMQQSLVQALTDEGLAILADGTAATAADINMVAIHGLGYPSAKGGLVKL